jgi:hypothetical protein
MSGRHIPLLGSLFCLELLLANGKRLSNTAAEDSSQQENN